MTPDADGERRRVSDAYRGYADSPRKRRSWSAANAGNRAIRDELAAAIVALAGSELHGGGALLDVGCGTGWWLERLAGDPSVTGPLHGVELLADRAAAARRRVPDATIAEGDARVLAYEAGRFTVVTLLTVLSSLAGPYDVGRALGEAARVLHPRGALIVWEPRIATPANRRTLRVDPAMLQAALPGFGLQMRAVTLLPPLARRLGRATPVAYPRLAAVALLRTHRLMCARWAG